MAARTLAIFEESIEMATATDTRKILEAITASELRTQSAFSQLNIGMAGLQERVANMGAQVHSVSSEIQTIRDGKASRSELAESEARFEKELARVERSVKEDVTGFQSMYESILQDAKLKSMDDRLVKIEPLRDTWLQMMGARWAIGLISAAVSALSTWGLFKWVGK